MQYDTKSKDFKNISEGLIETFKKAGDESVKIEKKGLKINTKEDGSPVTNGDLRVNEIICDRIIQLTPNIPIISEETVDLKKKNTLNTYWLIDPIDGTTNFLHGIPHFAICIALQSKDEIVSGLIFDPIKDEMAQDMVVVGIVMIVMTIAYVLSVLMAYYGPNGEIIGNIRNEYWSFKGIHNIEKLLAGIFKMFAIDLIGLITGGILLWKLSSIDFVKEACKAIKKYFPFISLTIAGAVTRVSFKTGHRHIQ